MITGFFKLIFNLVRLTILLVILALIFHTWAIKEAVKFSLEWNLGTGVSIEALKMDWKNTGFEIKGLKIENPESFPSGLLADIPLVIVSVDMPSLLHGTFHFKTIGFNLKDLYVVQIPQQGLNIMHLKPLKQEKTRAGERDTGSGMPGSGEKRMPRIVIDELIMSIGNITFVELLGAMEKQKTLRIDIQGATYYDLDGTGDIVYVVATIALKRLGFNFLSDIAKKFETGSVSSSGASSFLERLKKAFS